MRSSQIKLDESILNLVSAIQADPSSEDKTLKAEGARLIAIFEDREKNPDPNQFARLRRAALLAAIEDLANGTPLLSAGAIGVSYEHSKLNVFTHDHSDQDPVNSIFSLRMKRTEDFKAWRRGEQLELPDDQTHACIYFLVTLLAHL